MNVNVKILTPSGWSKFQGVKENGNKNIWTVKTKKSCISGTSDHKIKLSSGAFTQLYKLKEGDILYGGDQVISVINQNKIKPVYDAINVQLDNQFYANDIVVSNCIVLSTPRGCVTGNSEITVRNKTTNKVEKIRIQELYYEM